MSGQFSSGSSAGPINDDSIGVSRDDRGETNAVAESSSPREMSRPGVGQQLQAGRLHSGMSVDDVARALKLSTRQVEALEDDDWGNLPGKTMIRGFVRNYARLVGLDGHALMSDLEGMSLPKSPELRGVAGTPVSMPKEGKTDRRDMLRVVAGMLVLILALLAYFFLPSDFWESTVQAFKAASQSNEVAVEVAVESSPASATSMPEMSREEQAAEVLPAETIATDAVAADAIPVDSVPEVPAPVASVLKFAFAQPSWVEVRDRDGRVIFSQKNAAGSQREVEGQPPFSLVIGNAAHVTLQYKGAFVDLSKRSKDDVARVTVE